MKVSFHGQSCVCIETDGKMHIVIDPFITDNPLSDLDPDTLPYDILIVTHEHSDYVGDAERIAERAQPLIICTAKKAVPIHYNTFPIIEQNPTDFISLLDECVGVILQPGESILL